MQRPARLDHALVGDRRQPFRRFVQKQDPRVRDEGPPDREHLLLSPAQPRAAHLPPVGEFREQLENAAGRPLVRRVRPDVGEGEVLLHRQGREQPPALGNVPHAARGDTVRLEAGQFLALDEDAPGGRRSEPHDRPQQRGLAHPVAAEHRDALAPDAERAALQDVAVAVVRVNVVEDQNRARGGRLSHAPLRGTRAAPSGFPGSRRERRRRSRPPDAAP